MSEVTDDSVVEPSPRQRNERRRKLARILARNGMEGVHVLAHEDAREVLTEKRLRLLRAIGHYEPDSIRELAEHLDRDNGQVGRDLRTLAEHALVTFETNGRGKRPVLAQEHVVVEPIV